MLVYLRTVMQRHIPTAEVDELCTRRTMARIKTCLFTHSLPNPSMQQQKKRQTA
jgi:hypothetical protein